SLLRLVSARTSVRRSTPWWGEIAQSRIHSSPGWTTGSPVFPATCQRRLLRCGDAVVSLQSRRRLSSMPFILIQESLNEVQRDRRVRRLCCADVVDDGCRLGHHDHPAPACEPPWLAAARLASGLVRVRRLYNRAFVDDDYNRAVALP